MNEYASLAIFALSLYIGFILFVIFYLYIDSRRDEKRLELITRPRRYKKYSKQYIKAWCAIAISTIKVADLHHELRASTRTEDVIVDVVNNEIKQLLTITFTLNNKIPLVIERTYYDWFECGTLHNLVNDILIEYYDKLADANITGLPFNR